MVFYIPDSEFLNLLSGIFVFDSITINAVENRRQTIVKS